jgi:predicted NBD/HSP70 family sugar kinase
LPPWRIRPATVRIGIDLGGSKIEALAIDAEGRELARKRIAARAATTR